MDGKYIFAIIVLGAFFLLILISFAFLEYARRKEEKLNQWINERYANKELNKFNYDTVNSDEEIPVQSENNAADEGGEGNKESTEAPRSVPENAYGKIDVEGIEEITGNYDGK